MKEYFQKLYRYNDWANRRVVKCLKDQNVQDEKILTITGHFLSALFIWMNRIKDLPKSPYKLWHAYTLDEVVAMAEEAGPMWIDFVENTESFDRILVYNNYVGDPYKNNVEHIMMHLVNHSTYHRAQVALLVRQAGLEPVNTDFITYDRVITGQLPD